MRNSNFLFDLIRELSYFSRQEKRTLFYLICTIFIIITLPYFFTLFTSELSAIPNIVVEDQKKELELFPFNPNTISKDSLLLLGFSERQSQTFINYRSKSTGFYKKEDIKKIFFITDTLYEQLSNYIILPERKFLYNSKKNQDKPQSKKTFTTSAKKQKININTADTTTFKTLYGIGSYFAKKMVDYRERLGGYYAVEQLLEIYNFGDERLEKIKPYLEINSADIRKINFATDTITVIGKHPYLNFKAARVAIKLQNYSKTKITVDELVNKNIITTEQAEKLKPYLVE